MSIMRCDQHDRHWDSDKMEECPVCVQQERYKGGAEYQIAESVLRKPSDGSNAVILARAYLNAIEALATAEANQPKETP